jgi:Fe-S-cluster-containing dehydrogenase component
MTRYAMAIDTRQCIGCQDCVVACNIENSVPAGARRTWVTSTVTGSFPKLSLLIESQRCNQCDSPPCVPVCPTGASHVSELGKTVQIDDAKCIKCQMCLQACPYGARFMNDAKDGVADKCTFCAHRLAAGNEPACVAVCPTRAMTFGDLDEPRGKLVAVLAKRKHYVLRPEAGTKPRVFYLT